VRALELLQDACTEMTKAKNCDNSADADRCVQRVQALLPRLFACRSISDGFGIVIVSLHFSFLNLRGQGLSRDQVLLVWRLLKELRQSPILAPDQGVERSELLESVGLRIDPPDIDDMLSNAQIADE
jgi:hypothetical protein